MLRIPHLLYVCTAILIAAVAASASVPDKISYQGRLTDDTGQPIDTVADLTFSVFSDPGGSNLLWTETHSDVVIEDGLFSVLLGSVDGFEVEMFDGQTRYLGIQLDGGPMMTDLTPIVSTPYAYRSVVSDTADYANAVAGGEGNGWVDDGSVVRLQNSTDKVGIGTSTPSENLVVGKDFADYPGNWVVIGDDTPGETTGLIIGEDANNQSWVEWRIDNNYLTFGSVESSTDHSYTLNLHGGRVGINCTDPSEPLVVGKNVTQYPGNWIVAGEDTPGEYAGLIIGEDADNHGYMEWGVNENLLSLGTSDAGVDYWSTLNLKQGNVGINCTDPSENLVIGNDLGSFGGNRITIGDADAGVNVGLNIGKDSDNRGWITWNTANNDGFKIGTKENGTNHGSYVTIKGGNVGINCTDPGENLVVGDNIASYAGNRIVIGDASPGVGTGLVIGEDTDSRSWILWDTDDNSLSIGTKENGINYGNAVTISNGTVQLPENSINDYEINDEPGIARNARTASLSISENWTTICDRSCTFPTDGFAVVLVTCELVLNYPRVHSDFAIQKNGAAAPHIYTRNNFDLDHDNTWAYETFSVHEVFGVTSGSNTFTFVGKNYSGYTTDAWDVSITVMFFPTAYGTVATAAERDNDGLEQSSASEQPMLFAGDDLPVASESTPPRESDQVAALRAEFEAELQVLREEIADLKSNR